jgi:hypothetical protein
MSCNSNPKNINKTFIVERVDNDEDLIQISACTATYTNKIHSCYDDTEIILSGDVITNKNILPTEDNTFTIGSSNLRFRKINSVEGEVTVFKVTSSIETPSLDLGYDNNGEHRIITANNSIIQDDILSGGTF